MKHIQHKKGVSKGLVLVLGLSAVAAVGCKNPAGAIPIPVLKTDDGKTPIKALPAFIMHPRDIEGVYEGMELRLEAEAKSEDGSKVSYQWYHHTLGTQAESKAIIGATDRVYVFNAMLGEAMYYVTGTTETGSSTSDMARVMVAPRILKRISLEEGPLKKEYIRGETIDGNGLKIRAEYNTGDCITVLVNQQNREDFSFKPAMLDEAGTDINVKVLWGGKEALIEGLFVKDVYKVSFDTSGGAEVPSVDIVEGGTILSEPRTNKAWTTEDLERGLYVGDIEEGGLYKFGGWYADEGVEDFPIEFPYRPAADMKLYAKWIEPQNLLEDTTIEGAMSWLKHNATDKVYTIVLDGDIELDKGLDIKPGSLGAVEALSFVGKQESFIKLSHYFLNLYGSITVKIGNKVTMGNVNLDTQPITVGKGSTFVMTDGAKITGCQVVGNSFSGAVYVEDGGAFIMKGGEISDNQVTAPPSVGGGVFIRTTGIFIKSGGVIKNNKAKAIYGSSPSVQSQQVTWNKSPEVLCIDDDLLGNVEVNTSSEIGPWRIWQVED